jgi:hypothetical protein
MNIGKKILSALVEVTEETPALKAEATVSPVPQEVSKPPADGDKFRQHFDKLFADANLPGPDYYEFARMVDAMNMIPDEKSQVCRCFCRPECARFEQGKIGGNGRRIPDDRRGRRYFISANPRYHA